MTMPYSSLHEALLWLSRHPLAFGLAKGALLLCAVCALAEILAKTRLSAAARHAVLAGGMACALLVPLMAFVPAPAAVRWELPAQETLATVETQATRRALAARAPGDFVAPPASSAAPENTWADQIARVPSWVGLAALWAAGALVVAGFIARNHLRLLLSIRRMAPAHDPRLLDCFAREKARHGAAAELRLSADPDVEPATFGVFAAARVVLPASATNWPQADLRAVLAHELAHVARRDWAVKLATQAMVAVYWFHPAAWRIAARLEEEAECACDDRALASGSAPCDYADCVISLARTLRAHPSPAFARASAPFTAFLQRRITMLLDPSRSRRPLRPAALFLGAVLAAPLILVFGSASCTASPDSAQKMPDAIRANGYEAATCAYPEGKAGVEPGATPLKTVLRKDGKEVRSFPDTEADSFSPDGRYLLLREVAADDDCQWRLWDVQASRGSEKIGGRWSHKATWSENSKSIHFTVENKELGQDSDCRLDKIQWGKEGSEYDYDAEGAQAMAEHAEHAKRNPIPPGFGEAVATISQVDEMEPGLYGYSISYVANGKPYGQNVFSDKKPVDGQQIRIRYQKDEPLLHVALDELKYEK